MLKLAVALAVPTSMMVAAAASTSFVVVDVRADNAPRIIVPVPLILAQAAASFIPQSELDVDIPEEVREFLPVAREALAALRDVPDFELVRVENGDELVVIRKVEDVLEIRVDGRKEQVEVNVPLEMAADVLEDLGSGDFHPSDVIRALRRVSRTDLVRVRDGNDHVKIWIW